MKKDVKLPPTEYSNAMNLIYRDWDFSDWEQSKEWRLWNAGRASALHDVSVESRQAAEDCDKKARL